MYLWEIFELINDRYYERRIAKQPELNGAHFFSSFSDEKK